MMRRKFRTAIRAFAFCLMFIIPILNIYEIYAITGTYYAVNLGGLGVADPSAILQSIFAAGSLTVPLMGAALFPVLLALLFGRVWCGWMCPYLVMSDGVNRVRRIWSKTPTQQSIPVQSPLRANVTRFVFLVIGIILAGAIGIPVLNYVNAPGILSAETMILVKNHRFTIEILFILSILLIELLLFPRFWCRLFCPTGSVVSAFKTPLTLRVENHIKNPKAPCCKEHYCFGVCPMGLDPYKESKDLLCVNCGKCIDACPYDRLNYEGFMLSN